MNEVRKELSGIGGQSRTNDTWDDVSMGLIYHLCFIIDIRTEIFKLI